MFFNKRGKIYILLRLIDIQYGKIRQSTVYRNSVIQKRLNHGLSGSDSERKITIECASTIQSSITLELICQALHTVLPVV